MSHTLLYGHTRSLGRSLLLLRGNKPKAKTGLMEMDQGPWESIHYPSDLENAKISGHGFQQTPQGKLRNNTWYSLRDKKRYGLHKAVQKEKDLR